jgi:hypothetical protein
MIRFAIFLAILLVGMPVIWACLSHARKHRRVSFFGFRSTSEVNNPKKFNRVVRSYRMQLLAFPIVAAFVAAFMELPK